MMTPDEITYIREWAKKNEWRNWHDVPSFAKYCLSDSSDRGLPSLSLRLNNYGLTIASLADAFEQACETADSILGAVEPGFLGPNDSVDLKTIRRNREELLK